METFRNNPGKFLRRKWLPVAFIGVLSMLLNACQQEVEPTDDQRSTYIKVFGSDDHETATAIERTSGNDLFITRINLDLDKFDVLLTDEYGDLKHSESISGLEYFFPQTSIMKNGDVLVNSYVSSHLYRFNEMGEMIWGGQFDPNLASNFWYGKPVEGYDGKIYISYTNGLGTYLPALNYIDVIDENSGKSAGYYVLDDYYFGNGKLAQFLLYNWGTDTAYMIGSKYLTYPHEFGDFRKFFIAKWGPDTIITKTFDEGNENENDIVNAYVPTSDGGVAVIIQKVNWFTSTVATLQNSIEVFRFDKHANLMWRKQVFLNSYSNATNGIRETSDGGFILTGHAYTNGNSQGKPFFVKLDKDGKVITQKILDVDGNAMFLDGFQTEQGDLFMTGSSDAFGRGVQNGDAILIRADQNGNWQK